MSDKEKKKELTEEELKEAAGGRIARNRERHDFEEGAGEKRPSDAPEDA